MNGRSIPSREGSSALAASTSATAYTPLQFCEVLHAFWAGRSLTLPPVASTSASSTTRQSGGNRRKNGKGTLKSHAESSDEQEEASDSSAPAPQRRPRRLLREGKSFYLKVDLAASPSCVRHVHGLQHDPALRAQMDKLVSMAQDAQDTLKPHSHSIGASPSGSMRLDSPATALAREQTPTSPSKKYFRTAQQILYANTLAETLERRIYIRMLIGRTILRYIEKNTGCRYIYKGDRVDHYAPHQEDDSLNYASSSSSPPPSVNQEQPQSTSAPKKARCVLYYSCASAEYDTPVCGGTLRICVDLDIGQLLVSPPEPASDPIIESSRGATSDAMDLSSATVDALNRIRTPAIIKTYGTKPRSARSLLNTPASATFPTLLAANTPRTSTSRDPSLPPLIFALRLTHLTTHKKTYNDLRKEAKLAMNAKEKAVDGIKSKIEELERQLLRVQSLEPESRRQKKELEILWRKVRRARTPVDSEEEESPGEDEDEDDADGDADRISKTPRNKAGQAGASAMHSSKKVRIGNGAPQSFGSQPSSGKSQKRKASQNSPSGDDSSSDEEGIEAGSEGNDENESISKANKDADDSSIATTNIAAQVPLPSSSSSSSDSISDDGEEDAAVRSSKKSNDWQSLTDYSEPDTSTAARARKKKTKRSSVNVSDNAIHKSKGKNKRQKR